MNPPSDEDEEEEEEEETESLNIEIPNRGEIQLEQSIAEEYYLKPEFVGSDASAYE